MNTRMRPIQLISCWSADSRSHTQLQFHSIGELKRFCQELIDFGSNFDDMIFPTIVLDCGVGSCLEVGLSTFGWRLDIWFPTRPNGCYWALRNTQPDFSLPESIGFFNPQHSTYPSTALFPMQLVLRAVEEWATRQSISLTIGNIPDLFKGA